MKPRVYLETSGARYRTARLLRDIVVSRNHVATPQCGLDAAERIESLSAALGIQEASDAEPQAANDRLAALDSVAVLDASDESMALGQALTRVHAMLAGAARDAAHNAIAVVNGVDYLTIWNLRHIANTTTAFRFEQVCRACPLRTDHHLHPQLTQGGMTSRIGRVIRSSTRQERFAPSRQLASETMSPQSSSTLRRCKKKSGRPNVRYPARRLAATFPIACRTSRSGE